MLIDKLLFLNHGGGTVTIPGQAVPAGVSPLNAIIAVIVLLAIGVGLWILFTRKKSI